MRLRLPHLRRQTTLLFTLLYSNSRQLYIYLFPHALVAAVSLKWQVCASLLTYLFLLFPHICYTRSSVVVTPKSVSLLTYLYEYLLPVQIAWSLGDRDPSSGPARSYVLYLTFANPRTSSAIWTVLVQARPSYGRCASFEAASDPTLSRCFVASILFLDWLIAHWGQPSPTQDEPIRSIPGVV